MNKLAFCYKKPVEHQYLSSSRKDTHVYNNCYEIRSRAIKKTKLQQWLQTSVESTYKFLFENFMKVTNKFVKEGKSGAPSKHEPENVGGIALERQAGRKTFDPTGIRTIDLLLHNYMHFRLCYFALNFAMLQPTLD